MRRRRPRPARELHLDPCVRRDRQSTSRLPPSAVTRSARSAVDGRRPVCHRPRRVAQRRPRRSRRRPTVVQPRAARRVPSMLTAERRGMPSFRRCRRCCPAGSSPIRTGDVAGRLGQVEHRAVEARVGEDGRVDPAATRRSSSISALARASSLGRKVSSSRLISPVQHARTRSDRETDPLLGAVVEVALEPPPLERGALDDPGPDALARPARPTSPPGAARSRAPASWWGPAPVRPAPSTWEECCRRAIGCPCLVTVVTRGAGRAVTCWPSAST